MSARVLACIAALAVVLASAASAAPPMSVASLQHLLQSTPRHEVRFTETRESPWLSAPVQSSGTMRSSPAMLEKRTDAPRAETWRLLGDRMQLVADSGSKDLLFKDAPAAAVLANALREAVTGDLAALDKDFRLTLGGDEAVWTVQLVPRGAEAARVLKQIELQGSRGQLLVIVILDAQGNRTTTRLQPAP